MPAGPQGRTQRPEAQHIGSGDSRISAPPATWTTRNRPFWHVFPLPVLMGHLDRKPPASERAVFVKGQFACSTGLRFRSRAPSCNSDRLTWVFGEPVLVPESRERKSGS